MVVTPSECLSFIIPIVIILLSIIPIGIIYFVYMQKVNILLGIFRIMSEIDKDWPRMEFPDGCQNDYFVSYTECPKCGSKIGY